MLEHPEYTSFNMYSDLHYQSRDYAKEELTELSAPFRIRFIICRDPKFDTPLIDTEIDGKYTMLTNRNDLHAKNVIFRGGEKITMRKKVQ